MSCEPRDEEAPVSVEEAVRFLRSQCEGTLLFDGQSQRTAFVVDPATGALVMPVMTAATFALEHVLHTPDESDGAMSLLLSPEEIDAEGALADRWRAHHGEPADVRFVRAAIDMARWRGCVFDGEALTAPDPLALEEQAVLRALNADRDALTRACRRALGVEAGAPCAVGADAWGVFVKLRFGPARLSFDGPVCSSQEAVEAVRALAAGEETPS